MTAKNACFMFHSVVRVVRGSVKLCATEGSDSPANANFSVGLCDADTLLGPSFLPCVVVCPLTAIRNLLTSFESIRTLSPGC